MADELFERITHADEAISVAQGYINSAQWSDQAKFNALLNALITVHDEITAVAAMVQQHAENEAK